MRSLYILVLSLLWGEVLQAQVQLDLVSTPKTGRIFELARHGSTLYAATDSGVFKSNGQSWQRLRSSGLDGVRIVRIATREEDEVIGFNVDFLIRSTNAGSSWRTMMMKDLAVGVTINEPIDILVTDQGTVLLATEEGMLRSTDFGETWARANTGMSTAKITTIARRIDGQVFCAQSGYICRSTDDGKSWKKINSTTSDYHYSIGFAGIDTIYLGGSKGIYRSTDDGGTWRLFNLGGYYDTPGTSIAVDAQGRVFASTYRDSPRGGVYQSEDGGKSWNQIGANYSTVNSLLLDEDSKLYAGSSEGIYRTATPTLSVQDRSRSGRDAVVMTMTGLSIPEKWSFGSTLELFDVVGRRIRVMNVDQATFHITWDEMELTNSPVVFLLSMDGKVLGHGMIKRAN